MSMATTTRTGRSSRRRSDTPAQPLTVTKAATAGLTVDGRFTGLSRLADIDTTTLVWECDEPAWFAPAISELRWARDCGERHAAILIRDRAFIAHPYALTLRDTIDDTIDRWEWDPYLDGFWIIRPEEHHDEIYALCRDYDIAVSPVLDDHINGLEQAVEIVRADSSDALAAGFVAPSGFASGRELKPHQVEAVLALAINHGGLLADQVGLGKGGEFVCGLVCLNNYLREHGKNPALPVVLSVTNSMKLEIATEITKWVDDARVEVLAGQKPAPIRADADFIVLNHELLHFRLQDLLRINPKAFIADEAHVFKNQDTKRTQAAQELADAVRDNTDDPYVVMATGTPFLNAPRELFALLSIMGWRSRVFSVAKAAYAEKHGTTIVRTRIGGGKASKYAPGKRSKLKFVDKDLWPERAFEYEWCGGRYDKYGNWWNNEATNPSTLNKLLLDLGMIRRRKSDVMHPLPPLHESLSVFDLSEDDQAAYKVIETSFREWLIEQVQDAARNEGRSVQRAANMAKLRLDLGEDIMKLTALREQLALLKVPRTVDWIHEFMDGYIDGKPIDPSRRKLIVYVHHDAARDALVNEPSLQQYGLVHILPGTKQKEQSIVEHKRLFQTDDSTRLIVCTMAAREGHTLTAAKDVYLHEIPFVPSWIVQMVGRAWARLSEQFEPHEAYLHYAVARDTIDAQLVRMNAVKKAMFSAVIDGEGQDDNNNDLAAFTGKNSGGNGPQDKVTAANALLEAFAVGRRELEIAR